ncbi:hypothetical protein PMIN02_008077 [Paraphaeosphaeria minitans]
MAAAIIMNCTVLLRSISFFSISSTVVMTSSSLMPSLPPASCPSTSSPPLPALQLLLPSVLVSSLLISAAILLPFIVNTSDVSFFPCSLLPFSFSYSHSNVRSSCSKNFCARDVHFDTVLMILSSPSPASKVGARGLCPGRKKYCVAMLG